MRVARSVLTTGFEMLKTRRCGDETQVQRNCGEKQLSNERVYIFNGFVAFSSTQVSTR